MTDLLSSKMNLMSFDNTLKIYRQSIGSSFYTPKQGYQFHITRPSFKTETKVINQPVSNIGEPFTLKGIDRRGIGNYTIERQNFLADDPLPRQLYELDKSYDKPEITLSEKTLNQMFRTLVADESDILWLNEKARLLATGLTEAQLKVMLPLGRPQRQIYKNTNLAEASKNVESKMNVIHQALNQNRLETKADIQAVSQDIINLLGNVTNLRNMTSAEMIKLKEVVNRLKLPKTLREAGFSQRLFSKDQYNASSGVINAYIISKTDLANLQAPITVLRSGKPPASWSLSSLITNWPAGDSKQAGDDLNFPALFLDLENNTIIDQKTAFSLVYSGVDNGIISGKPLPAKAGLSPPNPPPLNIKLPKVGEQAGDVASLTPSNRQPKMLSDDDLNRLPLDRLIKYGRALARYQGFANIRDYIRQKYNMDDAGIDNLLADINLTRNEVRALRYI